MERTSVTDNVVENRVCSYRHVALLDNFIRRMIHNPNRLFRNYVRPGMRVLDIGCGGGFASLGLASMVGTEGTVVAADLQPEMLAIVKEKARAKGVLDRMAFHQCRPDRVGATGPFDFILAFWMAHETPDPSGFLDEVLGLLAPEGRFFLIEPTMHVSKDLFRDFVAEAEGKGFAVVDRPGVLLSRAVVLKKDD